jgi:hypothetical protein
VVQRRARAAERLLYQIKLLLNVQSLTVLWRAFCTDLSLTHTLPQGWVIWVVLVVSRSLSVRTRPPRALYRYRVSIRTSM